MQYIAREDRYERMEYRNCGENGLKLPIISLGLWHNFGGASNDDNMRDMLVTAFDHGITHFDIANNYGPPPGSAEENFGRIFKRDFRAYRDEVIISTKAGYRMWPGPYGDHGSKKYLMASLDQSLKRMGLDYVDIFYHHRQDEETPLEETMGALDLMVKQGKALYVGISNYSPGNILKAAGILKSLGSKCLLLQPSYSMLNRVIEDGVLDAAAQAKMGCIAFSPLYKGILTSRYLNGIPADSRAAGASVFLKPENLTDDVMDKVRALNDLALERGQTMAQLALAWVLRGGRVTSALIGASKPSQIDECADTVKMLDFTKEELDRIDGILGVK